MSDDGGAPPITPGAARFARWQLAVGGALVVVLFASPFWGPRALAKLDFFRVRKVEVLNQGHGSLGDDLQDETDARHRRVVVPEQHSDGSLTVHCESNVRAAS